MRPEYRACQDWPVWNRAEDKEALTQLAHTSEHTQLGLALSYLIFGLLKSSVAFLGRTNFSLLVKSEKLCLTSFHYLVCRWCSSLHPSFLCV